ncbi:MAG: prenyltransferase/squalene oxidase repeat-containing protein [Terracidiphilus sp.]|jgi:geranylgeranyl transferase type-2 subunit beta
MKNAISRRDVLRWTLLAAVGGQIRTASALGAIGIDGDTSLPSGLDGQHIKDTTFRFIEQCLREDGGYSPSPDPAYSGFADTSMSDLAAVAYAAILARQVNWPLKHKKKSAEFIQRHQQPDGVFVNHDGKMDPKSDLAVLYNTVQGVVSLRALGEKPRVNPQKVMDRFFVDQAFSKLPWYTTSFFPLFYAALDTDFPSEYRLALERHMTENQAADGYLQDHVAATFHMVHFYRLIGQPTPKGDAIVQRVLRDQRPDGGWQLKEDQRWDVHSCFDAVFVLRQIGRNSEPCRAAIDKAANWALGCQNADGGFGHYPGWHSDMDAVYFQLGTLIQTGRIPGTNFDLPDGEVLGWGDVMKPGRIYLKN